LVVVGDAGK
jgi:hypothetical protein